MRSRQSQGVKVMEKQGLIGMLKNWCGSAPWSKTRARPTELKWVGGLHAGTRGVEGWTVNHRHRNSGLDGSPATRLALPYEKDKSCRVQSIRTHDCAVLGETKPANATPS